MAKSPPLPPGTSTPRSGIYEQVGPRGGRTGEQAELDPWQTAPADSARKLRLEA